MGWDPDGSGKDRVQPGHGYSPSVVVGSTATQYPWLPAGHGKYIRFEVRCAICHMGICGKSDAYFPKMYGMLNVFVPPCPHCFKRAQEDPKWNPNNDIDYPERRFPREDYQAS